MGPPERLSRTDRAATMADPPRSAALRGRDRCRLQRGPFHGKLLLELQNLESRFESALRSLNDDYRSLIEKYRQTNRESRSTPEPTYFDEVPALSGVQVVKVATPSLDGTTGCPIESGNTAVTLPILLDATDPYGVAREQHHQGGVRRTENHENGLRWPVSLGTQSPRHRRLRGGNHQAEIRVSRRHGLESRRGGATPAGPCWSISARRTERLPSDIGRRHSTGPSRAAGPRTRATTRSNSSSRSVRSNARSNSASR